MVLFLRLSLIAALSFLSSCGGSEGTATVRFDGSTGVITALVHGDEMQGPIRKDGSALLTSSASSVAGEITCVDSDACTNWVMNVYTRNADRVSREQFVSGELAAAARSDQDAEFDEPGAELYVGPSLSEEGRVLLGLASTRKETDELERKLGPWLELKSGGIAIGPAQTVRVQNANGSVTNVFGRLEKGTVLPTKLPHVRRLAAEKDSWGTGFMISLIRNAAAEYARTAGPGFVLGIGGIAKPAGGYNPPHKSHQNGLDADIAFMGAKGISSVLDRNRHVMTDKFDAEKNWNFFRLLYGQRIVDAGRTKSIVSMILVSPEIKSFLCQWARRKDLLSNPTDVEIMRRIRPTAGHDGHFHLRLHCSPHHPLCRKQNYVPRDIGCGSRR